MKSLPCLIFCSLLLCSFLQSGNAWAVEPFHARIDSLSRPSASMLTKADPFTLN